MDVTLYSTAGWTQVQTNTNLLKSAYILYYLICNYLRFLAAAQEMMGPKRVVEIKPKI